MESRHGLELDAQLPEGLFNLVLELLLAHGAAGGLEDIRAGLLDHGRGQGIFPFGEFGDEIAGLVPLFRIFRRRDQGGVGRCPRRSQGRLAYQIWSVEIWPWRMFFSRADSTLTSFTGKVSSINRLFIKITQIFFIS